MRRRRQQRRRGEGGDHHQENTAATRTSAATTTDNFNSNNFSGENIETRAVTNTNKSKLSRNESKRRGRNPEKTPRGSIKIDYPTMDSLSRNHNNSNTNVSRRRFLCICFALSIALIALLVGLTVHFTREQQQHMDSTTLSQQQHGTSPSSSSTTNTNTNTNTANDEVTQKEENNNSHGQDKEPKQNDGLIVGEHYVVLETIPHDRNAFTQGLTFFDGKLYEGTGLNGKSDLRRISPIDGTVLQSHSLEHKYFGEGITYFSDKDGNDRIIQITWQEQTGFVYDAHTFEIIQTFYFETHTNQGWGITYNAASREFIVSDGSSFLFVWDRDTLDEKRRLQVHVPQFNASTGDLVSRRPVRYLNELEYMGNGCVLANVWYQNVIVSINMETGDVDKIYDFGNLYRDRTSSDDVFNGISVTDVEGELFVTGKLWPYMYRIKLLA